MGYLWGKHYMCIYVYICVYMCIYVYLRVSNEQMRQPFVHRLLNKKRKGMKRR